MVRLTTIANTKTRSVESCSSAREAAKFVSHLTIDGAVWSVEL